MFFLLFHNLRSQGIKVGLSEWLLFLEGLKKELAICLEDLYGFGRAVLCTTEAQYDADLAESWAAATRADDVSRACCVPSLNHHQSSPT